MPDKKHDLKQCASSKSEEVGGAGYRKEVGVEVCVWVELAQSKSTSNTGPQRGS